MKERKAINLFLDKDINLLIPPRDILTTIASNTFQVLIHHTQPRIIHPNIERLLLRRRRTKEREDIQREKTIPKNRRRRGT